MKTDTATDSDIGVLTALNRDYIQSVQHGDVQRFAEILADDFLCSNPGGSLVDKKQFLSTDRSTGDNQRPHGGGRQSAHPRPCRDRSRAHQLHHGGWRAAEWPLYRCLGSQDGNSRRIRARDAVALFSGQTRIGSFSAGCTLASSLAAGAGCDWACRKPSHLLFWRHPVRNSCTAGKRLITEGSTHRPPQKPRLRPTASPIHY